MTTVKHKRGTGIPSPDDIEVGEIAIDTSTGTAYTKKAGDGSVVSVGGDGGSGGPTGGSGTITAAALGAINAGDLVVVNPDGTVSAAYDTAGSFSVQVRDDDGRWRATSGVIVYDSKEDCLLHFYEGSGSDTGIQKVQNYHVVDGALVRDGEPYEISSWVDGRGAYYFFSQAVFSPAEDKIVGFLGAPHADTNQIAVSLVRNAGNDQKWDISKSYFLDNLSSQKASGAAIYDPKSEKIAYGAIDSSSRACVFTFDFEYGFGTKKIIDSNSPNTFNGMTYHDDEQKLTFHWTQNATTKACAAFINPLDSKVFEVGPSSSYSKDMAGGVPVYDPSVNKTFLLKQGFYASADIKDEGGNWNMNLAAVEAAPFIIENPASAGWSNHLGRVWWTMISGDGYPAIYSIQSLENSLIANSISEQKIEFFGKGNTSPAASDENGQALLVGLKDGSSPALCAVGYSFPDSSSSLSSFVGISNETVPSGGDLNINLSVDGNQSGLQAGTRYYVGEDGRLTPDSNSLDLFVGVAMSSTKIVIKG
jgi:hypothetical protein